MNTQDELEDILTPEEFCNGFLPKASPTGKRNGFRYIWPKLTKELRDCYKDYAKNYKGNEHARLLQKLILEQINISRNPDPVKIIPGSVIEAFFPFADPPDLSKNLANNNKNLHKTRPALVVQKFIVNTLTFFLLAKITDAKSANKCQFDIDFDYQKCNLRKESRICSHILTSLNEKSIIGLYGNLHETDRQAFSNNWHKNIKPDW